MKTQNNEYKYCLFTNSCKTNRYSERIIDDQAIFDSWILKLPLLDIGLHMNWKELQSALNNCTEAHSLHEQNIVLKSNWALSNHFHCELIFKRTFNLQ